MEELTLGESLEIANVAICREHWKKALLTAPPEFRIAVDQLSKIDTAGLQLLLAMKNEAAERGTPFSFSGDSEALRSQAEILGLASLLFGQTSRTLSALSQTLSALRTSELA